MNGASASTLVARIRIRPVRHRNTANGMSHRFCDSLRHKPFVRCAMEPPVLPRTMRPRLRRLRFLITLLPTHFRGLLRDSRLTSHEDIDSAAQEGRIPFDRAIDDWLAREIERRIEQNRDACSLTVRLQQRVQPWRHLAIERLQPCRTVNVSDRAERGAPFRPHAKNG